MSRGATSPPELPALATQLMQGATNGQKDVFKNVNSRNKRAITLEMLTLLENSIARKTEWSPFEKSLRFTVMLLAWWGSFRLGELLGSKTMEYHPTSILLASDIKFHEGSLSVWLRSPKVSPEQNGDVVEVWSVTKIPGLDPISALVNYLKLHTQAFGKLLHHPP